MDKTSAVYKNIEAATKYAFNNSNKIFAINYGIDDWINNGYYAGMTYRSNSKKSVNGCSIGLDAAGNIVGAYGDPRSGIANAFVRRFESEYNRLRREK